GQGARPQQAVLQRASRGLPLTRPQQQGRAEVAAAGSLPPAALGQGRADGAAAGSPPPAALGRGRAEGAAAGSLPPAALGQSSLVLLRPLLLRRVLLASVAGHAADLRLEAVLLQLGVDGGDHLHHLAGLLLVLVVLLEGVEVVAEVALHAER